MKSRLGAGGMGEVYLATDEKLGRDVALKLLPEAMTADAGARARLVREARTASALNHPNICHIYEVGEAGGQSYIAMEHVEGRPLSQSIPTDGLPMETVLRYSGQLADALGHAHDRSVLHRDLKSANVMVTPEGRVKILDFGLAKLAAAMESDGATRGQDSATQAGSVAGTLSYLAPEVLRGQAADARSDIWAAGVVLYEMVTGKLPFEGKTGFEVSAAILREPPAALPAKVPAGLRAIVTRCLAKEPARRYQRAGELRAAIEAISSDTATTPIVPQPAAAPAVPSPALPRKGPRNVQELLRGLFRSGETGDTRESLQVLGIWFLWMLGLVVVFVVFIVVSTRVKDWLNPPSQPGSSAPPSTTASPPPEGRLSTGGKPSLIPEANSYFEKAMMFMRGQFDVPRARELLEKALQADPKFADARGSYALTHLLQVESGISNETAWIYKAEQEAQQALRDDPDSVSAQSVLGSVYLLQGKRDVARQQLQRVFDSDARQLAARIGLMQYYRLSGEYPAGIALARQTLGFMPVFMISQLLLGNMLHESGETAAAVREFGGVLDQDPQNFFALRELAHGHIETRDTKTARMFLEKVRKSDRQNYRVRLVWALLYAREGKRRDAMKEMDAEVQKYAELNPIVTLEAAEFYAILGEKTKALDWLEKAVRNGDERTAWFQRDPLLESIRGEFRFKSLLDSIAYRRQRPHQ